MGFTYTCRAEEQECTDGFSGVFQSETVALNGFHYLIDSAILTDNVGLQFGSQLNQTHTFGLGHSLNGHTGHHGHYFGHLVFVDGLAL